jgi:hypothetical protein
MNTGLHRLVASTNRCDEVAGGLAEPVAASCRCATPAAEAATRGVDVGDTFVRRRLLGLIGILALSVLCVWGFAAMRTIHNQNIRRAGRSSLAKDMGRCVYARLDAYYRLHGARPSGWDDLLTLDCGDDCRCEPVHEQALQRHIGPAGEALLLERVDDKVIVRSSDISQYATGGVYVSF